MARRPYLLPEAVEREPGFLDRAKALQKNRYVINRKIRFLLDLQITRVREIRFHHPIGDLLPGRFIDCARIEELAGISRIVALNIIPVVIRPHDREVDPFVVGSLEESPVQRPLEIGPVVVVIPIENERIESMIGRRVDLSGHHQWIGFVLVSPERRVGLLVPGKPRARFADKIPFGEARIFRFVPSRMWVRAGIVIRGNGDVRRSRCFHFCFSQMTQARNFPSGDQTSLLPRINGGLRFT